MCSGTRPGRRRRVLPVIVSRQASTAAANYTRRGSTSASLATTPGRPAADAPFSLAGLDGADLQVDAAVVAAGPEDDELSPSSPRLDGAILTGDVAGLDASSRSFDLANAQGTACVEVAAGARLLLVADDGRVASSTEIPLDDLVAGQTVEAFGAAGAACFQADAVVAFAG